MVCSAAGKPRGRRSRPSVVTTRLDQLVNTRSTLARPRTPAQIAGPQSTIWPQNTSTIDITLVRTLTDCDSTDMKFDVHAETTVKYGPERDRPLLINYEELNTWFKKTSLKATLNEDGTLKSLDSELSDKTGAVIGNIGKSAVNIAKIAFGAAPAGTTTAICNQETLKSIAQRNKLRGDIVAKEVEVAKLPTDKQTAGRQEIERLRGQLATHEAFLQATSKHPAMKPLFPGDSRIWSDELKPSADIAKRWIDEHSGNRANATYKLERLTTVYVRAVPVADGALVPQSAQPGVKSALYYRQPRPAELTLARVEPAPVDPNREDPGNCNHFQEPERVKKGCLEIATTTYMLPQAGMIVFLPLENGIFNSNVLRASFHPSGALLTFEYVTESQAEAASATLAAITGSGSEIATEVRTADTLGLEAQVKELELRQKLRTLRQQENSLTNSSGPTP